MSDKTYPGKQSTRELWAVKWPRIRRYIDKKVIPFLRIPEGSICYDCGEANPRMEYLKAQTGLSVKQITAEDFNFDRIMVRNADIIFAFDIVEHVQNALWFVYQMKQALSDTGSIYINLPENSRWLWGEEHYFEIPHRHFNKWIIKPLGLKIVREKRIFFVANWRAFLIGVRPLLRVLRGETTLRGMARSILCWNFRIYEIKKDI